MSSEPSRGQVPFEPRQKKKKPLKQPPLPQKTSKLSQEKAKSNVGAIPDAVSKRMVLRMATFSGIPTALGMFSFVAFYWVVSHDIMEIPTYVVLAVSLGLFGLGVLGLSYGIFSTSWDEDRTGSWWGWQDFKVNFARTTQAWRTARKEAKAKE